LKIDHLVRAVTPNIRAFAAITTSIVEVARIRHDLFPVAAAALGRTMTGALLLAANLKNNERVTLRILGDGPLGEVIADARNDGTVRGYVGMPHVVLPPKNGKLDVGGAVGKGWLAVTRFTGLKEPFTGTCALVSGEIAEDLAHYLLVSEQVPSLVALGVKVGRDLSVIAAGGLIVQAMPGADEAALVRIEERLSTIPSVTQMVEEGLDAKGLIDMVVPEEGVVYGSPSSLSFRCQCSRERVMSMLAGLGKEELAEMAAEGKAEVRCHFCGETYRFTPAELEEIPGCLNNKNGKD